MDGTTSADSPTYTVGQVARMAGVTVRTLHHYDEVGLLPPSGRAANGYRTYTDVDVARLQRILSWRELGFDLEQVRDLVATDGTQEALIEQLGRQHALLLDRIERLQTVAETVGKTLEAHAMGIRLTAEELLEVFGDNDPTEHAAEAEERWGDTDAYRESQRRTSSYTKADWVRIKAEEQGIRDAFAAARAAGLPPTSDQARAAAVSHREHITRWYYDVTPEIHQGLAEMYVADPRFTAHYDATAPGLAAFVRDTIVGLYSSSSEGS